MAMRKSDLGIVMRSDLYRVAYPSKTMNYLLAGCPVLATIEPESELARIIVENDLGVVSPPEAKSIAVAVSNAEMAKANGKWVDRQRVRAFAQDSLVGM